MSGSGGAAAAMVEDGEIRGVDASNPENTGGLLSVVRHGLLVQ